MIKVRYVSVITFVGILGGCGKAEPVRVLTGHRDYVRTLVFSPDGATLAAGDSVGCLNLWDVRAGTILRTLQPGEKSGDIGQVNWVQFSPNGRILASCWDGIDLWDPTTGKRLHHLQGHQQQVSGLTFSPDGKTLASCSADQTIKLWDVDSGKEIRTLTGHSEWVSCVAVSPDGRTLASGCRDGSIRSWRIAPGESGHEIRPGVTGNQILALSFLSGGAVLAMHTNLGMIQLFDVAKGTWIRNLKSDPFAVLRFSPDGATAATAVNFGEETTLRLLAVESGEELKRVVHWNSHPTCIAASPDGSLFALGTTDSKITLWKSGK